jgi:hypothetical protein
VSESNTGWREDITHEMAEHGETWSDIESCTLTESEMDEVFHHGYGSIEGKSFTLWTHNRVYFPICYDGAEWVDSVSRSPDGKPTEHMGGG